MCDVTARSGGARTITRPQWGRLYGLVSLPLAALTAVQLVVPPGALRTMAGCGLVLVVFATMALWVRLNRAALDQQDWCDCAWEKVTVRVIPSRRPEPERVQEEEEETWAVSLVRR
jgi:hypothetical protein